MERQPILQVRDLSVSLLQHRKHYPIVSSLSFDMYPGRTLAIIGESGSGKSLTAQALMHLLPPTSFSVTGQALFHDEDLLSAPASTLSRICGTKISMIFQNPQTSLNPVFTIEQQFQELIDTHLQLSPKKSKELILQSLEETGFHDPERCLRLYPHELSGGMLQRASIAMALLSSPEILIADEPTTALDVSVQYQILQLLQRLQKKTGMSLLMITHDMGVVAEMADDVFVVYAGSMAEYAPVEEIFHRPAHPYTRDLLVSRPSQTKQTAFAPIPGQPPHFKQMPSGCPYHPRCKKAYHKCSSAVPRETKLESDHQVRCWLYE